MPTKPSTGLIPQQRARRLLEDLLNYANPDLKVKSIQKLTVNWENNKPELAVMGTLESLVELTKADGYQEILEQDKINDVIYFFEKYLEIMSHFSQQGSAQRLFIFKFCDTDKEKNLNKFDDLCERKKSQKSPNGRDASNSHTQAKAEIQSNEEDLGSFVTSSAPSSETLRNKLTDLTDKYKKLEDAFQTEKQANQNLIKQIKTANSNLSRALRVLLILALPIQILSGAMYNRLNDIYQKNNSSVSSPSNTNNSGSNTSASNLPDFSRQTNTASSTSEKQKNNSDYKAGEKSQCP